MFACTEFKLSLIALAGLALLVVTLTHSLAPVGAVPADKGPRKFYLARTTHNGTQALSACAGGYHMASMWEIHDPSNLRYDTDLGLTADDSGFGPPTTTSGWIRTGYRANGGITHGFANCEAWTSADVSAAGTSVLPTQFWSATATALHISPWFSDVTACNSSKSVWCVQD